MVDAIGRLFVVVIVLIITEAVILNVADTNSPLLCLCNRFSQNRAYFEGIEDLYNIDFNA